MKRFFVLFVLIIAIAFFTVSGNDSTEQRIDVWAKDTFALFQDTAQFFSSMKPPEISKPSEPEVDIEQELKSLLPQQTVDLKFEPNLNETINMAEGDRIDISPEALLPNLFHPKQGSGTSFKGQLFTDEKDKIIGGELQLAIPTDM